MKMGKQKEEKEKRGERRTGMRPGAWLLGTTARHSEMKPDAEEGGRKRGAGVRMVHPGLGGKCCPGSKDPRRPRCVEAPGGGSSVAALTPTHPEAGIRVEARVGRAGPAIFVISPHLLSLLGLQFVWDSRVQAVTEAGAGAGLGRNA